MYFNIITKKTASLIASCCALGAAASNSSEIQISKLYELGEKIGIAFQLKDDLFDYGTKKIGKPTGIDIKEKNLVQLNIDLGQRGVAGDDSWWSKPQEKYQFNSSKTHSYSFFIIPFENKTKEDFIHLSKYYIGLE